MNSVTTLMMHHTYARVKPGNMRDVISGVTEFMVSVRLQASNMRDVISGVTEFMVSVRLQAGICGIKQHAPVQHSA